MTAAKVFIGRGWFFVALKLLSTIIQIRLSRSDYRNQPNTPLFRSAYAAGKATPSLASASFAVAYAFRHDWLNAAIFGSLAVAIAFFAAYVVNLRAKGKFFGMLDYAKQARKSPQENP